MQISVYNLLGDIVDRVEITDDVFRLPFNEAVVHQALVRQLANRRQGTVFTKTRGKVMGSTRKLLPQKHTGRARRGDTKSPLLRGGGVAFGPKPRNYNQLMPKKMRCLALKCVLSSKVREGSIKVLDKFELEKPKTKDIINILSALGVDSSVLIVTRKSEPNIAKSARNLINVRVLPSVLINVLDLLSYQMLVTTVPALEEIEEWLAKHASL